MSNNKLCSKTLTCAQRGINERCKSTRSCFVDPEEKTDKSYTMSELKEQPVVTPHNIISALAYCAVEQSPYTYPKNLQLALDAALRFIEFNGLWSTVKKKAADTYIHVDREELRTLIDRMCKHVHDIQIWNVTQWEIDQGITDANSPRRKVKFGVSNATTPEDKDFIDLDALSRNIFNMVTQ